MPRYVLVIDPGTKTMAGSAKGQPEDWRRASYLRDLDLPLKLPTFYCREVGCTDEGCAGCASPPASPASPPPLIRFG